MIEDIEITVVKSDRKTMALQIKPDCTVCVRAPLKMPDKEVLEFVKEKTDWIKKTVKKFDDIRKSSESQTPFTQEQINNLKQKAMLYIPRRIEHFAGLIGVKPGKITVRSQKTCWGSCSKNGNISINCLVMLMSDDIVDYILVHELCHLKEMNHSKNFWREVEKILPDYKERQKKLKEIGSRIIIRNK